MNDRFARFVLALGDGRCSIDGKKLKRNRYPILQERDAPNTVLTPIQRNKRKFVTLYSVSKALVDCVHEVESVQGTLRVQILEERRGLGRGGTPRVPLIRA